jgi:hypothetical protein
VPLRFPELVERGTRRMHSRKLEAVRSCDVVFANSRFTAGEAIGLLGVPEERVVVAYPGVDPLFRPEGEGADLGGPYVLSVSTLEPRKNLPALVAAFALLRHRRPELTLVLAGPGGWEERPLVGEGVRLLGFVPDEELARLYRGAAVFAYPSLFEGFGIPVAEALASGTPAVVSSHPSLLGFAVQRLAAGRPRGRGGLRGRARAGTRRRPAPRAGPRPAAGSRGGVRRRGPAGYERLDRLSRMLRVGIDVAARAHASRRAPSGRAGGAREDVELRRYSFGGPARTRAGRDLGCTRRAAARAARDGVGTYCPTHRASVRSSVPLVVHTWPSSRRTFQRLTDRLGSSSCRRLQRRRGG